MTYSVSVIMPALNEEANLQGAVRNVLDVFSAMEVSGELLIVDDGSTDRTGMIADGISAEYSFVSVLHHPRPEGIGASFWDGVRHSCNEIVVMLPGDGENDAAEILRYLPLLDHVDIVVPFVFNRAVRSLNRRLLSIMYREIIKASFGLALNYMNGTVMYRKAVFDGIELKNGGFFYQTELLIKAIRQGYLYAEVPYALSRRGAGDSSATTLRSLVRVVSGYLAILLEVHCGKSEKQGPAAGTVSSERLERLETSGP